MWRRFSSAKNLPMSGPETSEADDIIPKGPGIRRSFIPALRRFACGGAHPRRRFGPLSAALGGPRRVFAGQSTNDAFAHGRFARQGEFFASAGMFDGERLVKF